MGEYENNQGIWDADNRGYYTGNPNDKEAQDAFWSRKTFNDFKENTTGATPWPTTESTSSDYSPSYDRGPTIPLTPEQLLKKSNDARFAFKSMAYITGILSFLLGSLVLVGIFAMDIGRNSTNGQNSIKYTTWSIIAFAFFFVMFKVYNSKHKALKKRLDAEKAD